MSVDHVTRYGDASETDNGDQVTKPGRYLVFGYKKDTKDADIMVIEATLKSMGFTGDVQPNANLKMIRKVIKKVFQGDFREHGSLFVFFLTNGTEDGQLKAADEDYWLEKMVKFAMDCAGPSLTGKPKVFVVQAPGLQAADTGARDTLKDKGAIKTTVMPIYADILIAFAAKPGTFMFIKRDETFVQTLCKAIVEHAGHSDLETMVDFARENIQGGITNIAERFKPVPTTMSTLTKAVYLKKEAQNGPKTLLDIYQKAPNAGKIVVFNHTNFSNNFTKLNGEICAHTKRDGTQMDVDRITKTFQNKGFEIKVHHDLSRAEIQEILTEAVQQDFTSYGSLLVFVLTHGDSNYQMAACDGEYDFQKLVKNALGVASPTLHEKPIVFIIQACSGVLVDTGNGVQGPYLTPEDLKQAPKSPLLFPEHPNLLMVFASPPGYVSFRNQIEGSWFIQNLCQAVDHHEGSGHFDILALVRYQVAKKTGWNRQIAPERPFKQIPISISTLNKIINL